MSTSVLPGSELTADERAKVVQHLTSTRDRVLAEVAKLSDAQWTFKSAPDRWSVGQVLEHLSLSEPMLFGLQQKVAAGPAASAEQLAAAQGRDEFVLKTVADRTKKAEAPAPLQPRTQPASRDSVLAAFTEARARTIEYASTTKDELRARVGDTPLGSVDGYQWLLFLAAHTERHLAQINEVKTHARYPAR